MKKFLKVDPHLPDNQKVKRLKAAIGPHAIEFLLKLWAYYLHKGEPYERLSKQEIESACCFNGESYHYIKILTDLGFLEQDQEGYYQIHDWKKYYKQKKVKDNIQEPEKEYRIQFDFQRIICLYKTLKGYKFDDRKWDKLNYARYTRSAKSILEFFSGDTQKAKDCLIELTEHFESKHLDWTLETIQKHTSEWEGKRRKKVE